MVAHGWLIAMVGPLFGHHGLGKVRNEQVCDELLACFDDPELTFSARILRSMIEEGIGGTGRALADRYRTQLREEPLEILSEDDFIAERDASVARQKKVEAEDSEPFEALLARHA